MMLRKPWNLLLTNNAPRPLSHHPKQLLYLRHNGCTKQSSLSVVKSNKNPYLCPVNPIALDKNFQAMQTIKIFLGSSITELHYERLHLGDYLMNSVRPIFQNDDVEIKVVKCEDIRSGNTGEKPQDRIDNLLRECDVSVFMFKTRAGNATIHEFDVARELQKSRRHEIYVFCFDEPEEKKEESLKDFQKRLKKEEFYWYTCKDVTDLESQFILGLLKLERQLLGKMKPSIIDEESTNEKDADVRFNEYMLDEKKQAQRRKKIHKDIEDLLQQTKTVMANEDETIAARIFKVIELYKKANQWAAATAYDKEKYSHLLFDYAQFLNKYGLYKDAEQVFLRQIAIAEELYGKEHENIAASYNEIGLVYKRQGDYGKALEYYFKDLAICEKVLGTEHPDTATSYNNIAGVYYAQGDYDKALEYYFKTSEIFEKVLGTEHPSTATSYNNIGLVYHEQGDYGKALEYHQKALAIRENVLGTEHPSAATSYNNIAGVYYAQGDYGKALKYLKKVSEIFEKVLGTEHPSTATSYNNIGWVYREQGEYAKALDYYTKAYQIRKKKLGDDHPDTKDVLISINFVKEAMKSFPEK